MALAACASADLLHDNGEYVTGLNNGAGGADTSAVEVDAGYSAYGLIANNRDEGNGPYRIRDDFTIPAGFSWQLQSTTWYVFQTNSGTGSTITGAYVTLYDESGTELYGNYGTNRLTSGTWDGVYRVDQDDLTYAGRPVMQVTVNLSWLPQLAAGTYWLGITFDGSLVSGPWAVPNTPHGATDNAQTWSDATGVWATIGESNGLVQDFPFELDGIAVPEPAGLLMLALGALWCGRRRG